MYRKIAKNDAEIANAAIWAPVNSLFRKSPSGSIGSFTRDSITRKAASRTAAPTNSATIAVLPQPSPFPRSSASTSTKRPPISAV